jgi:hypothetical protein
MEKRTVAALAPKVAAQYPFAVELELAASTKLVVRALRENAGCVPHQYPLAGALCAELVLKEMSILPAAAILPYSSPY